MQPFQDRRQNLPLEASLISVVNHTYPYQQFIKQLPQRFKIGEQRRKQLTSVHRSRMNTYLRLQILRDGYCWT
jgi:hypothetical protein